MHLHNHWLNRSGFIKNTEISSKPKLSTKLGKVRETQEMLMCISNIHKAEARKPAILHLNSLANHNL